MMFVKLHTFLHYMEIISCHLNVTYSISSLSRYLCHPINGKDLTGSVRVKKLILML